MLYVLYAFLAGAASAFAFEPTGWWPLLPIAFAFLCEFLWRSKGIWRALFIGWAFGLGQFVIGLNWIATAFTYQAAMPAFLWMLPASAVPADSLAVLNVRIVQPNIGQEDKWRPGFDQQAALRLAQLSGPASNDPRLLLWPEAAVTEPLQDARTDEHQ